MQRVKKRKQANNNKTGKSVLHNVTIPNGMFCSLVILHAAVYKLPFNNTQNVLDETSRISILTA
jgi:hypothetical protein